MDDTVYCEFDKEMLGEQIGVGATADVYTYGSGKIVKIFHDYLGKGHAIHEWKANHAAELTGFPVPKNYGICQIHGTGNDKIDDCQALIQEKIDGISVMKQVLMNTNEEDSLKLISKVVEMQVKMHKIVAEQLEIPNQKEVFKGLIKAAPLLDELEKDKLYAILNSLPTGNKLCHGDYHFDNIMIRNNELVCFDWCDITCGNPTGDLARSLLIFLGEATPESIPKEVLEMTIRMQKVVYEEYIKLYTDFGGIYDHLDDWMAIVAASRLSLEVDENKKVMLRIIHKRI